jgi:hypothetical protein
VVGKSSLKANVGLRGAGRRLQDYFTAFGVRVKCFLKIPAIPNLKPWRTAKSAKNAKENQKTALYLVFLSALGELGGSMIFPMLKRRIIWRKGCLFQTSNFRFGIAGAVARHSWASPKWLIWELPSRWMCP